MGRFYCNVWSCAHVSKLITLHHSARYLNLVDCFSMILRLWRPTAVKVTVAFFSFRPLEIKSKITVFFFTVVSD